MTDEAKITCRACGADIKKGDGMVQVGATPEVYHARCYPALREERRSVAEMLP